jgi:hypothetical protein
MIAQPRVEIVISRSPDLLVSVVAIVRAGKEIYEGRTCEGSKKGGGERERETERKRETERDRKRQRPKAKFVHGAVDPILLYFLHFRRARHCAKELEKGKRTTKG